MKSIKINGKQYKVIDSMIGCVGCTFNNENDRRCEAKTSINCTGQIFKDVEKTITIKELKEGFNTLTKGLKDDDKLTIKVN